MVSFSLSFAQTIGMTREQIETKLGAGVYDSRDNTLVYNKKEISQVFYFNNSNKVKKILNVFTYSTKKEAEKIKNQFIGLLKKEKFRQVSDHSFSDGSGTITLGIEKHGTDYVFLVQTQ
jgi:hypothetical protein